MVSGLSGITAAQLRDALGGHFELTTVGTGSNAAAETWEMIEADGSQNVFGFVTPLDSEWLFARLLGTSSLMAELAPEQSEAWRGL